MLLTLKCFSFPLSSFLLFFFLFPQTCQSCFKTIPKGDVVVLAEFEDNSESSAFYHAACFCCCICLEWLVDLTYYRYGNKIYCGRHHAELSKQRCFGCDEVSSNPTKGMRLTVIAVFSKSALQNVCTVGNGRLKPFIAHSLSKQTDFSLPTYLLDFQLEFFVYSSADLYWGIHHRYEQKLALGTLPV